MNYVYTLLLQKWGIKCGNEGVGKRGLKEEGGGYHIDTYTHPAVLQSQTLTRSLPPKH